MKRYALIVLVFVFAMSGNIANAQRHTPDFLSRMDKFRTEKISYLTLHLDLTPAEAEKFWPVYNQLEKERRDAQKHRFELESKISSVENSLSEKQMVELTRKFAKSLKTEGDLAVKYNEEFLKILPAQKVLALYKTERKFKIYMIKKYRDHGKKMKKK